ncbi:MAG: pyridoxal phosphate-dependent aminotransferase [Candidatus Promineifilaceae bacterium]|nr:pyridoxal phosphate-dependent aminotransferase [Candidatus Promineifilaceae bacterium]
MDIQPFATEHYYAEYEFTAPHLLSASDCESLTVGELLELSELDSEALSTLSLGYTESQGHPDLRVAVAQTYNSIRAEEVVVLTAPVEGIYLAMRALLEPGDEVIVLVPAYDTLKNLAAHITGQVRVWELSPTDEGWQLDFEALERLLNDRTRLIVVNFPHNPSGFLPTVGDFERLLALAGRRGTWVFCDELYRGLEFGPAGQLPSAVDRYGRAIVLAGLSKTHGLPGLRAGWLLVRDRQLRQAIMNWKYYTTICPAAPSERLALAALQAGERLVARNRAIIVENLEVAEPFFQRWAHFLTWRRPLAGSVALADIAVPSAEAYCHRVAQEAGVVLLPGSFMGAAQETVRFGFGRRDFAAALGEYEAYLQATM